MNRQERLRRRILDGRSDTNVRFDELRSLLVNLGFVERVRGSHHIFRKTGVAERINLQRDGSHGSPTRTAGPSVDHQVSAGRE